MSIFLRWLCQLFFMNKFTPNLIRSSEIPREFYTTNGSQAFWVTIFMAWCQKKYIGRIAQAHTVQCN